MSRNVVLIVALLLLLSINLPSSAVAMPTNTLTILPEECSMLAGEELSLTLDRHIPPDAVVSWDVDKGSITSVLPGSNAVFIAPSKTAAVTISVTISSRLPGAETLIMRQCIIRSPNDAPRGLA